MPHSVGVGGTKKKAESQKERRSPNLTGSAFFPKQEACKERKKRERQPLQQLECHDTLPWSAMKISKKSGRETKREKTIVAFRAAIYHKMSLVKGDYLKGGAQREKLTMRKPRYREAHHPR